MSCQFWYYKYQTKKQCEDDFDGSFSPSTSSKEIRETKTTTAVAEIKHSVTSMSTTTDIQSSTVTLEDDFVTNFDINDDFEETQSSVYRTTTEETPEHILDLQIETPNLKLQFKRKTKIDGEVLTIVIFLEVGALTMLSCFLYYGMKFFGKWWRRGHNYNLDNAERSHLPLHQHQGDNPEETIRPRIEEVEDDSDAEEPAGYSTAIENTQMTNTTMLGFSPIGPPPNRTVSMTGLETAGPSSRTQQQSSSGPIPLNIDQEIEEEEIEEDDILNGTQLLQQPHLPAAEEIIQSDESDDESTASTNERRYPVRIRNKPERYGFPFNK